MRLRINRPTGAGAPRWLIALSVMALMGCPVPDHHPISGRVDQEDFPSQVVGDTYRIMVRLPPGYDDGSVTSYPVVYQLDANFMWYQQFEVTAGAVSELARKSLVPEAIVVGIGYPYEDVEMNKGRSRDYTSRESILGSGGSARFIRFLRDELFPHIEGKYRAQASSSSRTISGHSLGGHFALHALMQTDPPFGRFVAADPSFFDGDAVLFEDEAAFAPPAGAHYRLYLSLAVIDDAEQNIYFREFSERIARHPEVELKTEALEAYHANVVAPSFEHGLQFVLGTP